MVFHNESKILKNWMLDQPFVKEESLTDWLLYRISKETPKFYYKAFSRNEEAKNGADWEWWIITKGTYNDTICAYRFFVQAKKLISNEDNYSRLNYSNKNGNQIDLLIEHAEMFNAFPCYMFYSTTEPDIKEQKKNIRFIDPFFLNWCSICDNGGYLSDAYVVNNLLFGKRRERITDIHLLNHSLKLSILDKLIEESDEKCELFLSKFNNWFISNKEIIESNNRHFGLNGIRHFGSNIPNYLTQFIDRRNENLSWFELQMREQIPDVDGIAVLDLRR